MVVMASRDYIPAVENYLSQIADTAVKKRAVCEDVDCTVESTLIRRLSKLSAQAYDAIERLRAAETEAAAIDCARRRAECYCERVLPIMQELRAAVDEMETITASKCWPVPTYGDMMFRV